MFNSDSFHPNLEFYPKHIALIPDGGRRWAEIHGYTNQEAYAISTQLITQMIDFVFLQGTDCFSVFLASTSNFKRTSTEIEDFCSATWNYINNTFLPYAIKNQIRVKIVGTNNINMKPFIKFITDIEAKTKDGMKTVYFCFNYNSFDEIDMAAKQACKTGDSFINHLQIPHPVDILIRTGNANVLSGFLLPQIAAARIFFYEKLFNDFTMGDLNAIINAYLEYELKYGE